SSASLRPATVRALRSSPRSKRTTVLVETCAASAKSFTPQLNAVRAILHCKGNNIAILCRIRLDVANIKPYLGMADHLPSRFVLILPKLARGYTRSRTTCFESTQAKLGVLNG